MSTSARVSSGFTLDSPSLSLAGLMDESSQWPAKSQAELCTHYSPSIHGDVQLVQEPSNQATYYPGVAPIFSSLPPMTTLNTLSDRVPTCLHVIIR